MSNTLRPSLGAQALPCGEIPAQSHPGVRTPLRADHPRVDLGGEGLFTQGNFRKFKKMLENSNKYQIAVEVKKNILNFSVFLNILVSATRATEYSLAFKHSCSPIGASFYKQVKNPQVHPLFEQLAARIQSSGLPGH